MIHFEHRKEYDTVYKMIKTYRNEKVKVLPIVVKLKKEMEKI